MYLSIRQINVTFSVLICCVAAYAFYVIFLDIGIGNIYQGWSSFFDQHGSIYPSVITFFTVMVPVSIVAIACLVYFNKRTFLVLLPMTHVAVLFSSPAVYGLVTLILIWWFSKYAIKAT